MHRKPILRISAKVFMPFILLFGLYVQFHGDFGPGGGFQAGVIFGASFVLYALIFGLKSTKAVLPPVVLQIIAALGVLLYAGVGVFSLLVGDNFLNYNSLSPEHPLHGQHYGILLVELGVGMTVFSSMTLIFYTFAGRGRE